MPNKQKTQFQQDFPTAEVLSPELKALLADTRPVESLDLDDLAASVRDLDRDPEHVAETLKGVFVEDVLRALEEEGMNKSRLGKTRQQISYLLNEEKLNNFTIETMAEMAAALGRHLVVRMLGPNERVRIEPTNWPTAIEDCERDAKTSRE